MLIVEVEDVVGVRVEILQEFKETLISADSLTNKLISTYFIIKINVLKNNE